MEDYTQVSVLSLYDIVTPGGLDAIGADWHCLENQKNVLDGFQRTDSMVLGGECTRRWSDSPIVSSKYHQSPTNPVTLSPMKAW